MALSGLEGSGRESLKLAPGFIIREEKQSSIFSGVPLMTAGADVELCLTIKVEHVPDL